MRTVELPGGPSLPALGLGTWRIGESARSRRAEVAALRLALDLGYRVIDSAEMYGEGGAEEVVGAALAEAVRAGSVQREEVFLVSKVYPHHADRPGVLAACEASRKRLGIDRIDLYLLHWRGSHPLEETVGAFEHLCAQGRIGRWGVSNFDTADMIELWSVESGTRCGTNQVYYSLSERGPEFELLPWLRARGVPLMAYSPIDQGQLARDTKLRALAAARGATPAQLALAWVLAQPGVMAIAKAGREVHLRENFAAAALALDEEASQELDRRFPAPRRKRPLAML